MYNRGIVSFLQAKKVSKIADAINQFLQSEEIKNFTAKNHFQANNYIQQNWTKFSTFIDSSIKSGKIAGKAVKLNHYYDEERVRKETIKSEFEKANLSWEERLLLNYIKENGPGKIQLFLQRCNVTGLGKDTSYISKKLQWLPLVKKAIEAGYSIQIDEFIDPDAGGPETW